MTALEKAVAAAARTMYTVPLESLHTDDQEAAWQTARDMVSAAAPIIAAEALREAADALEGIGYSYPRHWLRDRADATEGEHPMNVLPHVGSALLGVAGGGR